MLAGSALMISAETAGRPRFETEKTGLNSESTNSAPRHAQMIVVLVKRLAVRVDQTALLVAKLLVRIDPHDPRRIPRPVENSKYDVLAFLEGR